MTRQRASASRTGQRAQNRSGPLRLPLVLRGVACGAVGAACAAPSPSGRRLGSALSDPPCTPPVCITCWPYGPSAGSSKARERTGPTRVRRLERSERTDGTCTRPQARAKRENGPDLHAPHAREFSLPRRALLLSENWFDRPDRVSRNNHKPVHEPPFLRVARAGLAPHRHGGSGLP
jgi:hypothetical protein